MKSSEKMAASSAAVVGQTAIWNVLVIDTDAKVADIVRKVAGSVLTRELPGAKPAAGTTEVRVAMTPDATAIEAARVRPDLLVVNLEVAGRREGEEAGLEMIRRLKRQFPTSDLVAVSRSKKAETCLDAWRAGAGDFLRNPIAAEELERVLCGAAERRVEADRKAHRYKRLREACKRLNKARHEISQQVDLLCNDLVRAYQDMAHQLNMTQTAAEYGQVLQNELDVEGVLRRTMEWVLRKLGPVNAAIYVPSQDHYFALGAYLNLDTQADATLIETLSRTIVDQARGTNTVWIDRDDQLEEMFAEDAALLKSKQWLAVGCRTPRECLAVLTVFRGKTGAAAELTQTSRGLLEAIAPILAEKMEQALGLYQRLNPYSEEEQEES
jgi:FixJ family two-component response regulator